MLRGIIFKSRFLHYTSPPIFSSFPSFSLSPHLFFSLSSSFSFSLSHGLCLDRVLADVKNDFADCNFLRCREELC